jgi:hypothetical protein
VYYDSPSEFAVLSDPRLKRVGSLPDLTPKRSEFLAVKTCSKQKKAQLQIWGWAFELKCDSLPRLGFKEVVCIHITDPPVAQVAYKNDWMGFL